MIRRFSGLVLAFNWVIFSMAVIASKDGHAPPGLLSKAVGEILDTDEVLLEYFITDSTVTIAAACRESSCLAVQSLDRLFWGSLVTFREKMKSADPVDFRRPGEVLYMFLVRPVKGFIDGKHRLIIIPGERLWGLPFEALIGCDAGPGCSAPHGTLPYLIHEFEVIYHCSTGALSQRASARDRGHAVASPDDRFSFIGFSPGAGCSQMLPSLPGCRREITGIGSLFDRYGLSSRLVFVTGDEKGEFEALAGHGRIIHLAAHFVRGRADVDPSGFIFRDSDTARKVGHPSDGLLAPEGLAALEQGADLVVLSGCATGAAGGTQGKSPACSLVNCGARNILSTLWNVTDNLSCRFMLDFYRSWLSGKTYSAALREVKLKWISHIATSIPTIWAPYVLLGE